MRVMGYGWGLLCGLVLCAGCLERDLATLNPCLTSGETESVGGTGIDRVDILFVVDNSLSMLEEQVKLRAQFPKLIRTLVTGERQDGSHFSPVNDMHLAVITTDMGTPGEVGVPSCTETGDDGVFQHVGNQSGDPMLQGCAGNYPSFLQFRAQEHDPEQLAKDFACIASVGSGGCGFEQQLEAPLKALWPRVYTDAKGVLMPAGFEFLGAGGARSSTGHGDETNAGFLRNDTTRPSLLAIVLVTDEDDCSARTSVQFSNDPAFAGQHLNLRCHENQQNLWPISRYVDQFRKLRPERPDLVVFAAITGVPTRLIEAGKTVDFTSDAARDAFYDGILADSEMQETPIDTAKDLDSDPDSLQPGCQSKDSGAAAPARRIVELAKGLGTQATVQSICADTFEPAMDAVIALIAERLTGVCLSQPLARDRSGVVSCKVMWELPKPEEGFGDAPTSCAERPYLSVPEEGEPQLSKQERTLCEMRQLPVRDRNVVLSAEAPEGWYYDNFSPAVLETCSDRPTQQRISFTDDATPPRGVTVSLQCLREAQRYVSNREDVDPTRDHAEIGDSCEPKDDVATPDQLCWVALQNPAGGAKADGTDRRMFCHPERNVCVLSCSNDDDCPAAWTCDDRESTLQSTKSTLRDAADMSRPNGAAICVNPTCGGGDED